MWILAVEELGGKCWQGQNGKQEAVKVSGGKYTGLTAAIPQITNHQVHVLGSHSLAAMHSCAKLHGLESTDGSEVIILSSTWLKENITYQRRSVQAYRFSFISFSALIYSHSSWALLKLKFNKNEGYQICWAYSCLPLRWRLSLLLLKMNKAAFCSLFTIWKGWRTSSWGGLNIQLIETEITLPNSNRRTFFFFLVNVSTQMTARSSTSLIFCFNSSSSNSVNEQNSPTFSILQLYQVWFGCLFNIWNYIFSTF